MGNMVSRERWLVSEEWWSQIVPLRPKPKRRARGRGGRPRVPDRQALHGILFVLRTGSQWKALHATGIGSRSSGHRRLQPWVAAGVFAQCWEPGWTEYDELKGMDWRDDPSALGWGKKLAPTPQIGWAIDEANRNDFQRVKETLESIPVARPTSEDGVAPGWCLDKGYEYDEGREWAQEFGYTTPIRSRGEEAQARKRHGRRKERRWG